MEKKTEYYINSKINYKLIGNKLWIWNKARIFTLKLPKNYFIKKESNKIKMILLNHFYFITFLKHIWNNNKKLLTYYYYRLKLKGLGYRVTHLTKKLIRLYFNKNNFYYMHIPSSIIFKYKTRRLFFISSSLEELKNAMRYLLLIKKQSVYRLKGLFAPKQIFLVKPGKNKFR